MHLREIKRWINGTETIFWRSSLSSMDNKAYSGVRLRIARSLSSQGNLMSGSESSR